MSESAEYAIPLFALIDPAKVAPDQPMPEELAEHLGNYLEGELGIRAISTRLIVLKQQPYLVLHGVEHDSLPALCSLVDVQRTQLYRYQRIDEQTVTLTPLNVKISD